MMSLDANLLLYAYNEDSPRHRPALTFLTELSAREDVAISELVLAEFYTLLRNPAVLATPLSAGEAVQVVQRYRHHPDWDFKGFGLKRVWNPLDE
jgi:uncharacterized protein